MEIEKERDRFGSYFVGLKIRAAEDDSPPLITGNQSLEIETKRSLCNTNMINKLWTMMTDKVTDVMDYVMDESTGSDEYDGCDGKNEKSDKFLNNVKNKVSCNTINEENLEVEVISPEFLKMPSHISQKQGENHTKQLVTDNNELSQVVKSTITVGDKVTVEDAPSYWSWATRS